MQKKKLLYCWHYSSSDSCALFFYLLSLSLSLYITFSFRYFFFSAFQLSFIDLKTDERMRYSIGGCVNKFHILFIYIANKNLCMQTQISLNPFTIFFSVKFSSERSEWMILILSILVSRRSDTFWYSVCANWFDHFNHSFLLLKKHKTAQWTLDRDTTSVYFSFHNNILEFTLHAISSFQNSSDAEIK